MRYKEEEEAMKLYYGRTVERKPKQKESTQGRTNNIDFQKEYDKFLEEHQELFEPYCERGTK